MTGSFILAKMSPSQIKIPVYTSKTNLKFRSTLGWQTALLHSFWGIYHYHVVVWSALVFYASENHTHFCYLTIQATLVPVQKDISILISVRSGCWSLKRRCKPLNIWRQPLVLTLNSKLFLLSPMNPASVWQQSTAGFLSIDASPADEKKAKKGLSGSSSCSC